MKQEMPLNESPLLNAKTPKAKSTINLNKMTKKRFTQMGRDANKENSSFRVILYAIIVIVIGVGAALLVRQLIERNESAQLTSTTDSETTVTTPVTQSIYNVDLTAKRDSMASNPPIDSSFKNASLVAIGSQVEPSTLSLEGINYTKYETFVRVNFQFATAENKVPQTNITDSDTEDRMIISTAGLTNIPEELKMKKSINDVVRVITFDANTNEFQLTFSQNIYYRVYAVNASLFIDIRTEDEVTRLANLALAAERESNSDTNSDAANTDTTNTTNSSNSTGASKPAAPFYTNAFGQNTQYVSSKVNKNKIALDNYYVWDEGSFFEFSFAQEGQKGDEFIPNAKAYAAVENSKNYIYIEIENLTRAVLPNGITAGDIQTRTTVDMSRANFVNLTLVSFNLNSGKATYKIELKNKADFKLLSQLSYRQDTQILSIQIKD